MEEVNTNQNIKQNHEEALEKDGILKKISTSGKKETLLIVAVSLVVVLLGIVAGWFLSGKSLAFKKDTSSGEKEQVMKTETEAGLADESVLPDSVEGMLVEGGVEGEGTHHLERPGGPSQNVYLTSTVIDLQSFVGKKVKVWGETLSGIKAGWLMDVGKIKVVE